MTDQLNEIREALDEYGYARRLAEAIFQKHYARDSHYASGEAVWQPCDDLIGLLTQIDNMVSGLSRLEAAAVPELSLEDVVRLAERFHETYERLAPSFGYETRPETRQFDPTTPNGKLMIAVCAELASLVRSVPVGEVKPVAWEGGEGWESLAWELCADENGEEACNELIWEGGPVPEPWGDRWMKYEGEAKRLIALVHKHTTPPAPIEGWRMVPVAPTEAMIDAAKGGAALNPSMAAIWRKGLLGNWRAMLAAVPQPGDKPHEEPAQVAPEYQAQVDQMAADAEARREKERGILLEAANHLEGDGHFMPAEDADWAAGWIRRQIGAGATP